MNRSDVPEGRRILVTGANGFIGTHLCRSLLLNGYKVRGSIRGENTLVKQSKNIEYLTTGPLESLPEWKRHVQDIDTVVHLAAVSDVKKKPTEEELKILYKINVESTKRLAEAAVANGARRFILISSIKVNGETNNLDRFSERDFPKPMTPYGKSKLQAEKAVMRVCRGTGTEVVVIRPTIVYGPGSRGNIFRLIRLVSKGYPLPIGGIENRRSIIAVRNLCDLIITCIEKNEAGNELFIAADEGSISTPDLVRAIATIMNKRAILVPIPTNILMALGILLGKRKEITSLTSSLEVDIGKIKEVLGWRPIISFEEALRETVEDCISANMR